MPRTLHLFGDRITILVTGEESHGAFALFEAITPPGGGPPLHRHQGEDEWFFILEGRVAVEVDGERSEGGAASAFFARRGTAHSFRNVGDTPLRMIIAVAPPRLDKFFLDVANVWRGGPPADDVLMPLFTRHGLELLGPPMAR